MRTERRSTSTGLEARATPPNGRGLGLLAALLLCASPAFAGGAIYDPEIALLAHAVQKESLPLLRQEFARHAAWLALSGPQVLLEHRGQAVERRLADRLGLETDLVQAWRDGLVFEAPGNAAALDRLSAELRAYHGLREGPPLKRFEPSAKTGPGLKTEDGPGADVASEPASGGAALMPAGKREPTLATLEALLRKRAWALDAYEGDFSDLAGAYRSLGYKAFYRLQAPYASAGKEAYVLAPEPGLRPRLVLCAFASREYFRHVRAGLAASGLLAAGGDRAIGRGSAASEGRKEAAPAMRTLSCAACPRTPPAIDALRGLLSGLPETPANAILGYGAHFASALKGSSLGAYENEHWRAELFRLPAGTTLVLESRLNDYGEILALAAEELARRGAKRVFVAGPAASADAALKPGALLIPTEALSADGSSSPIDNLLAGAGRPGRLHHLSSPWLATQGWLRRARERGAMAYDPALTHVAKRLGKHPGVQLGLAAIAVELPQLLPEEDRAVYMVEYESQAVKEQSKRAYRDAVLKILRAP